MQDLGAHVQALDLVQLELLLHVHHDGREPWQQARAAPLAALDESGALELVTGAPYRDPRHLVTLLETQLAGQLAGGVVAPRQNLVTQ